MMDELELQRVRDELYEDLATDNGVTGVGIADGEITIYVASAEAEATLREMMASKDVKVPFKFVVTGPTRLLI